MTERENILKFIKALISTLMPVEVVFLSAIFDVIYGVFDKNTIFVT